ncbi:hypothetical protein [Streptomyces sp. RPT161]|uniref:hypothetical protein n=1 Tax=Streptomyces sp. RPT161 TaxID=3015993 RepID=UPI0022B93A42|nr:hypothetical protein [Streptomyces sp. RPT161]
MTVHATLANPLQRASFITSFLLLGTALTGCSTGNASSAPENLCGMKVDKPLYAPLFPSGKKVTETGGFTNQDAYAAQSGSRQSCYYWVDGKIAVSLYTWSADSTSGQPKASIANVAHDDDAASNFRKIDGKYDSASWNGGEGKTSGAVTGCPIPQKQGEEQYSLLIRRIDGTSKDEQVLRKLINPAMQALLDMRPCQKSN